MLKTSRMLYTRIEPAFRIEDKIGGDGTKGYDLIWQANGEDEEIAMLCELKDLKKLKKLLNDLI